MAEMKIIDEKDVMNHIRDAEFYLDTVDFEDADLGVITYEVGYDPMTYRFLYRWEDEDNAVWAHYQIELPRHVRKQMRDGEIEPCLDFINKIEEECVPIFKRACISLANDLNWEVAHNV